MDIVKETFNSFVSDLPQVELKMTSPASEIKQGDKITLVCNLRRSNPPPRSFSWFKNWQRIDWQGYHYDKIIDPDDRGSYRCSATNDVGTGQSEALELRVKCKFQSILDCMSER